MTEITREADFLNMLEGIRGYARDSEPLAPLGRLVERALGGDELAEQRIRDALDELGSGVDPGAPEPVGSSSPVEAGWTLPRVRALAARVVARLTSADLGEVAALLDRSPIEVLDQFIAEVVRLAAERG
jgi:hypothetical protein